MSGTYLITQHSFTCGTTNLTKWHYCYYTQAVTNAPELSMTVAVWSLDIKTNTYVLSPGSARNITLNPIRTLAKIFCVEESLDESDYVEVSQGDVIGVVLGPNNAIPVLGSAASSGAFTLEQCQNERPQNIPQQSLSSLNMLLHLYASTSGKHVIYQWRRPGM